MWIWGTFLWTQMSNFTPIIAIDNLSFNSISSKVQNCGLYLQNPMHNFTLIMSFDWISSYLRSFHSKMTTYLFSFRNIEHLSLLQSVTSRQWWQSIATYFHWKFSNAKCSCLLQIVYGNNGIQIIEFQIFDSQNINL